MVILGIETSCDETSSSILKNGKILTNTVCSQLEHVKYGGVVPEIASKNHEKLISKVVHKSIEDANIDINDVDAVAVTYGPGLVGSLLVGLNFAKGLSLGLNIPLIGINHLEGHIVSNYINKEKIIFPYLCLLVSGGHTQIVLVEKNKYKILSTTVDDAAGEAFDKGAIILGLNYPGGPEIEKKAQKGKLNKYKFPIPYVKSNPCNYSFSGLKTSLLYKIKSLDKKTLKYDLCDIAASYQEAIIDTLFSKLNLVLTHNPVNNISIVGGVSINKRFRQKAKMFEIDKAVSIVFPDNEFCTDNAAMIAMAGYLKYKNKSFSSLDILPNPRLIYN